MMISFHIFITDFIVQFEGMGFQILGPKTHKLGKIKTTSLISGQLNWIVGDLSPK